MQDQLLSLPVTATKVLIIEDEGEMCLLLHVLLQRQGIELDHVMSLEKAMKYLQESQPDLILLDNQLPDGKGVDFLKWIKNHYPAIRVVMVSGHDDAKTVALQCGAVDFIAKPFSRNRLVQSLQPLLN